MAVFPPAFEPREERGSAGGGGHRVGRRLSHRRGASGDAPLRGVEAGGWSGIAADVIEIPVGSAESELLSRRPSEIVTAQECGLALEFRGEHRALRLRAGCGCGGRLGGG